MHPFNRTTSSRAGVRAAVLGTLAAVALTGTVTAASAPAQAARPETIFHSVKTVEKYVPHEKFAAPVVEKKEKTMTAGETKLVRPGKPGVRSGMGTCETVADD